MALNLNSEAVAEGWKVMEVTGPGWWGSKTQHELLGAWSLPAEQLLPSASSAGIDHSSGNGKVPFLICHPNQGAGATILSLPSFSCLGI